MFAGLGTALARFWSDQKNAFRRLMYPPRESDSVDYWRIRYAQLGHDHDQLVGVHNRLTEQIAILRQGRDALLQNVYPTHDQISRGQRGGADGGGYGGASGTVTYGEQSGGGPSRRRVRTPRPQFRGTEREDL